MTLKEKQKRRELIKEATERCRNLLQLKSKAKKSGQTVETEVAADAKIATAAAQQLIQPAVKPEPVRCFGFAEIGVVVRAKALKLNDGLQIANWARSQVAGKQVYLLPLEEPFKRRIANADVIFKTVIPLDGITRIAIPASWIETQEQQLLFDSQHCFGAES